MRAVATHVPRSLAHVGTISAMEPAVQTKGQTPSDRMGSAMSLVQFHAGGFHQAFPFFDFRLEKCLCLDRAAFQWQGVQAPDELHDGWLLIDLGNRLGKSG